MLRGFFAVDVRQMSGAKETHQEGSAAKPPGDVSPSG
jgi:hypothetical protein